MLFKQNLSSKLPMRTMPLEQIDMAWEQAKKARLVDLKYVSLYRDLLQPLTSKQNLSSKIQLLWHIFTLKRLSYGIRFKTMLSMTKWASFSWNSPATTRVDIGLAKTTLTVWVHPHDLRSSIASRTYLEFWIFHKTLLLVQDMALIFDKKVTVKWTIPK